MADLDALDQVGCGNKSKLPAGPAPDAGAAELRAWAAEAIGVPAGVTITKVEQFGKTSKGSVIAYLSDGERITFESIREMLTKKSFETAVMAGITLRMPGGYSATDVLKIAHVLLLAAERHDDLHEERIVRVLGMDLLDRLLSRECQTVTIVSRAEPAELWRGLVAMRASDADYEAARQNGLPERVRVAEHAVVIVDRATGERLIRVTDFQRYVRKDREQPDFGGRQLDALMRRVGWTKPNTKEGKLQARRPRGDEHESAVLGAVVWIVPAGWEQAEEDQR